MFWQSFDESCNICQCISHNSAEMDKENQALNSPSKHDNDISLYGNSSPSAATKCELSLCNGSPKTFVASCESEQRMEDFDINTQDSGYDTNLTDKEQKVYNFKEPIDAGSGVNGKTCRSIMSNLSSLSMMSMESMDDGFMELSYIESTEENTLLPSSFDSLVTGSMKGKENMQTTPVTTGSRIRATFRRSVSLMEEPSTSRIRSCLFKCETDGQKFRSPKRLECEMDIDSPVQNKRCKISSVLTELSTDCNNSTNIHPKYQRSFSENEASIKSALQRSSVEPDLIGDFSKPFCLPLVSGRHQDLKSISPTTLADLLRGKFDYAVASYKVIDCRYPYEFEGGHIRDAINYYTKEQITQELFENRRNILNINDTRRNILVFHCEFSSERGPNLSRFLRSIDRSRNNEAYPMLYYPEIYLLDGGYKNFYEQYSELCMPVAYKPMLDPAHQLDLKHFRAKSKTWNVDTRGRPAIKSFSSIKRLGLF